MKTIIAIYSQRIPAIGAAAGLLGGFFFSNEANRGQIALVGAVIS